MAPSGKTVILGVTGGIAAYKAAQLASDLAKAGHAVHVIMTENATQFVSPLTFETLTGNRAITDTFDRNFQWNVQHVALAKRADVFAIAPATANVIAKVCAGIADDMLTTTFLAATCPKVIAPAMNTNMYENPVTQRNLSTLLELGFTVVDAGVGRLACADLGKGRLAELADIEDAIDYALSPKDLAGKRVLVTAGPTRERLDPVRYLSNFSTGKMGYALAKAACARGAEVVLVSGPTELRVPLGVTCIRVESANEMATAVKENGSADIIIKAAAVADYRPAVVAGDKMKKGDGELSIPLERNEDILQYLGAHKRPGQLLCGFSMETRDLLENSQKKLEKKHADMIVANNLKVEGAGFGTDTNVVTLITKEGAKPLEIMGKAEVAHAVLDALLTLGKE